MCNLSCPDCNRFNDHSFRGHQRWSDYEKDYQEWGNKLSATGLIILGGEPLLNPTICDWIKGINRCFRETVQVLTNGTRLNKTPGLYEALTSYNDGYYTNWIGISVHNVDDLDQYIQEARQFLKGNLREYHGKDAKDHTGHPISSGADYTFIDEYGVAVRLWIQNRFYPAALQRGAPERINGQWQPGRLRPFNNPPLLAHEACGFVQWKNYHMIKGKLHKCGPCVLLAEFDQQNPLDISQEDREIMNSYQALSAWADDKTTHRFFKSLDRVIPQCKFCPTQEDMKSKTIHARLKKTGATGTFA